MDANQPRGDSSSTPPPAPPPTPGLGRGETGTATLKFVKFHVFVDVEPTRRATEDALAALERSGHAMALSSTIPGTPRHERACRRLDAFDVDDQLRLLVREQGDLPAIHPRQLVLGIRARRLRRRLQRLEAPRS